MSNEKIEMSKLYSRYPRYYKGYDMDELFRKVDKQEPMTDMERDMALEVITIYDAKHDAEVSRRAEESRRKSKEAGHILPAPTRCPPYTNVRLSDD